MCSTNKTCSEAKKHFPSLVITCWWWRLGARCKGPVTSNQSLGGRSLSCLCPPAWVSFSESEPAGTYVTGRMPHPPARRPYMEVALGECTLRLTSYGVLQPGSALGGCHTLESLRVCPKKILKESQLSLEPRIW